MFYCGFVAFMLMLVSMASRQTVDFVTTDYYNKELQYQGHLDKVSRANALPTKLQWVMEDDQIVLVFPINDVKSTASAEILFYNPADSKKDVRMKVNADAQGLAIIKTSGFKNGIYRMQIDWNVNSITYYNEGVININQ